MPLIDLSFSAVCVTLHLSLKNVEYECNQIAEGDEFMLECIASESKTASLFIANQS
jgi:hypothetical protein